jgi:hypothetical protein
VSATAPSEGDAADPFSEGPGHTAPRVEDLRGVAKERALGIAEPEGALALLRGRFEQTQDPEAQAELAVEALAQVERQLDLARGRRHELDSIEGKLWARRNRLERFLIHIRGRAWWHARRSLAKSDTLASDGR